MNGFQKKNAKNLHFWAFWAKMANFGQFLAKIGKTGIFSKNVWNIFSLLKALINCKVSEKVIRKYVNPFKLPGIFYICPAREERTILKQQAPKNTSSVPTPLPDQVEETDETIDVEANADTQESLPPNDDSATTAAEI